MKTLSIVDYRYQTPPDSASVMGRHLPTLFFYLKLFYIVAVSAWRAKRKQYTMDDWAHSSQRVLRALESVGVSVEVSGLEHLQRLDSPCVIIGNHMSLMDSVILPTIILPFQKCTFIIKESLLNYPVFKHVMRATRPIAVTRQNPRQDLLVVMEKGRERLGRGLSVIVFPQTTRSTTFDPTQFSTLGVKLAQKAGVAVIPLALKTDAWTNGQWFKDFGRICPQKKVHVAFAPPIILDGKGKAAQQEVIAFIQGKFSQWQE